VRARQAVQDEGGEGVDDLVAGKVGGVLSGGEQGVSEHAEHRAHGGGDQRGVAGELVPLLPQVFQVVAEDGGVVGQGAPGAARLGRCGDHRLEPRGRHRKVLGEHLPVELDVHAQLRGVGQIVLARLPLGLQLDVGVAVHVAQQRGEQVLLAGEVLVEGPGGPARRPGDVGDLGVEIAAFDEQPACGVLERTFRLGRLLLANPQCATSPSPPGTTAAPAY